MGLSPRNRPTFGLELSLALVVATSFFLRAPHASAQATAGSVTEIEGTARLDRAGQVSTVVPGMSVLLRDTLTTEPGAHLAITLADGSKLLLAESGTVTIDELALAASGARQSTKARLLRGRLRAFISFFGGTRNFELSTPNTVTGVRGTDFELEYSEGKERPGFGDCSVFTDLQVHEGLVATANTRDPAIAVEVAEGYATTVPCDLPPLTPGPMGLAAGRLASPPSGGSAGGAPPPDCPPCSMNEAR